MMLTHSLCRHLTPSFLLSLLKIQRRHLLALQALRRRPFREKCFRKSLRALWITSWAR